MRYNWRQRTQAAPLKIAIAGCGISGLASALLLSRQGHSIVLFDQFDAPASVGSGMMLQPTGMAALESPCRSQTT
ncbi:NAD(P)-binding protein [Altererythrobacter gangjinensis]|uniref:NAD(P)-binding protein n=1 Tax=Pontixanthobacter gangjinensis TaxID=1028742 RepID=A0A6I4SKR2_9SPHN|nr:NAD(P)-binding protein [Pontixanthobacter gangjinensis]